MGGKGSGRNKKDLLVLIDELRLEIEFLVEDVYSLNKKLDRLKARWDYWLKKIEKNAC